MNTAAIMEHVHISRGNTKLGADIPSVNLPPLRTCRSDAPCVLKCYARKGRWRFSHNQTLLDRNLDIWNADHDAFKRDIMCAAFHRRFFRWHSAGDIPDASYLEMMVEVAKALPNTKFLCFTKKFELANNYLDIHKSFPENLRMIFSAWGSFHPENPYNLPVAYVRFKKDEQYSIPPDALQCKGYCGECTLTGASCWTLENGKSVVFNEH